MKGTFFILLAVLILFAIGKFVYNKITQPTIEADIYLSKVLLEKKIYYTVKFNGIEFNGVYDLNGKEFQDQENGKYKIRAVKTGGVFGLELLKNNKPFKKMEFDLLKQKLSIKA